MLDLELNTFVLPNKMVWNISKNLKNLELRLLLLELAANNIYGEGFTAHTWRVQDIVEKLGLSTKAKNYHELIRKLTKELGKKTVNIPFDDDDTKGIVIPWLSEGIYNTNGHGTIRLELNKKLEKYLVGLKGNYTTFPVSILSALSTRRALVMFMVMYMELQRHHSKDKRFNEGVVIEFSYETIYDILDIPGSYKEKDVMRKILAPIKKEIEENTNFIIEFESFKNGRFLVGCKVAFAATNDIVKKMDTLKTQPIDFQSLSQEEKVYVEACAYKSKASVSAFCAVRNALIHFGVSEPEKHIVESKQTMANIMANINYVCMRYGVQTKKDALAPIMVKALANNYVGKDESKYSKFLKRA